MSDGRKRVLRVRFDGKFKHGEQSMVRELIHRAVARDTQKSLWRASACAVLVAIMATGSGCVSAVSVGVKLVGSVVDRVDVDDLEEKLVGGDVAAADKELGERIDKLNDVHSERAWLVYPARSDPLGKDRYVIEVRQNRIVAISRVEKTPDAKFDIPRALILEGKVKGKPLSECEALLEMGKPLVTVRRESTGFLNQLYEGRIVKVGGLHYCILKFDENDTCEAVEFHGVGASTKEKPFESES